MSDPRDTSLAPEDREGAIARYYHGPSPRLRAKVLRLAEKGEAGAT